MATINAASASSAHIQAAIDSAANGDTVSVPAGSATWTSDVSVPSTKGVKIIGAGAGSTNINAASTYHLYLDTRETNSPVRVSGFTFSYTPGNFLRINYRHSGAHDFRVDHCDFDNAAALPIFVAGWTFGVIDNCNFNNQVRAIFIEGRADDIDGGYAGGYSWGHELTPGSADMVYVEDCYINNTVSYPGQAIDCNAGGRYCFRYNTLTGWEGIETHSACTPSNAGYSYRNSRWAEIYENTLDVNTAGTRWLGIWFRSCNGMAYNNALSSGYTGTIVADNETTCYTTCGGVWAKTQAQIDALTYPYQDQIGLGYDSGFGTAQATDEAKLWIFNNTRAGVFTAPNMNFCTKAAEIIQEDRDYFLHKTSFDGSSGIGVGLLSARPSSGLTTGVYYWATDEQTLYRSTGATTWATHYQPYTYPHPLREDTPITGFDNTFTATMAVSESETARLYVEKPHVRVVAGTAATYAIWVEAYNSFAADVTLDATGLPTNATDAYGTNPIAYNGTTIATIATTGVAAGTYSITFTGTAEGGEVGSVRVILEVVASDDCAPKVPVRKIRVKQGDNAVFTVIADPTAGYTGQMDLSASGVPTGASGAFADDEIAYNESTTYTVDSGTAAVGEHEIIITGEGPV